MAEPITVDNGSGTDYDVLVDDVTDGTLGTGAKQLVGLMDGTVGSTTKVAAGGGTEATALRVTVASDSTGVLSVDDNGATLSIDDGGSTVSVDDGGSALTVDNGGTFAVQATSAPATARTTDSIAAALQVDRLMNNLTAVTPAYVVIDHATSGDNTILAAQGASNIIVVHQLLLVAASAVTVRFESGTGGTALTGQIQVAANQGFVLPFSPIGWFRTAANTLLNLELSGAVSVDGVLAYTVVT